MHAAVAADGRPGHEPESFLFTISQRPVPLAIVEVVTVLDSYDRHDFARATTLIRNGARLALSAPFDEFDCIVNAPALAQSRALATAPSI